MSVENRTQAPVVDRNRCRSGGVYDIEVVQCYTRCWIQRFRCALLQPIAIFIHAILFSLHSASYAEQGSRRCACWDQVQPKTTTYQ